MSNGYDYLKAGSLQEQLKRMAVDLKPLLDTQAAVGKIVEQFWLTIADETKQALKAALTVAEALKVTFESLPKDAAELASAGWLIPGNAPIYSLDELAELLRQDGREALDQHMIAVYSAEDDGLQQLQNTVMRAKPALAEWTGTIEDAFWAYRSGRFGLVVPTGLSIVEGLVATLLKQRQNPRATNPIPTWQRHAQEPNPQRIAYAFWIAIDVFLKTIWSTASFDKDRPQVVNRHWILHGRCPDMGGQADALRLLVAIGAIADYWDILGRNTHAAAG